MGKFTEPFKIVSAVEAAVGAFIGVIFPYVLGTKTTISPWLGIIVTTLFLLILYLGLTKISWNFGTLTHILGGYFMTLGVSVVLGFFFGVITVNELFSFSFFGSTPIIISLVGVGFALSFDYTDRLSILSRYISYSGYMEVYDGARAEKVASFCRENFKNSKEIGDCERRLM